MKVVTVGRSSDNDVVINDVKVSRIHLQIVQNDSGICSVVDLNSANGTYVNGQKIFGEVRLQPHDVIRIGGTTLSWQEYVTSSSIGEQKINKPATLDNSVKRINWFCVWGIICTVVVILVGCIGLYVYCYNDKEQQKQESIRRTNKTNEERFRQTTEQLEAKRLQDKADEELFRQALREDRDKNRELATAKQKEAEKAKKQADIANKERDRITTKAKQEVDDANRETTKAKVAQQKAENVAEAAKKAEAKAKQAQEIAEQESKKAMELTAKFYAEEYEAIDKTIAKKVCERLKKEVPKDKNAKVYLKDLFNKADNKGKQLIIDAIQNVKQQKK